MDDDMNIERTIEKYKRSVERELERVLSRGNTLLFQAMRSSVCGGGKRFRPLLCLAAADSFGAAADIALPFACAIELIHNYSLIHDDLPCMDDDDIRRGRPTCHKAFGEDIALLAGDGLLTMAFEVMAGAEVPRRLLSKKVQVIGETAELAGADGMIGGQLLDITVSGENATEESIAEIMLKKTGALIVAAVRAGALLGGASPADLKAATAFAENIGLAFQVRDDIQDAAGKSRRPKGTGANYALSFGQKKAKERLGQFVAAGLAQLEKASIKSPVLRHLVRRLFSGGRSPGLCPGVRFRRGGSSLDLS
jgi:geranylgeranyl diphosphate synthase, type II